MAVESAVVTTAIGAGGASSVEHLVGGNVDASAKGLGGGSAALGGRVMQLLDVECYTHIPRHPKS